MMATDYARWSSVGIRTKKERQAYFRPHKCCLSDQHPCERYKISCGPIRRFILDITTVNIKDIRARSMFKSYASLSAERYRQFHHYPLAIHPFSKLRFWSEVVVSLTLIASNFMMPFWIAAGKPSLDDPIQTFISKAIAVYVGINIPTNLLTGYVAGKNKQHIILDKYKILRRYAVSWMVIDFLALAYFLPQIGVYDSDLVHLLLDPLGALRLFVLFHYQDNICQVLKMGVPSKTAVELVLFLTNYLSWNVVCQFTLEYYIEGTYEPVQPRNCSWLTIGDLWDESWQVRLMYSMTRAVAMMRKNSNINLLEYDGCFEIFFMLAWLIAQSLIIHCSFKYMLAVFGSQSAKSKYYMMSKQIQTYMDQRRFPPRLKAKILKFYAIRFQSHFFVESTMLGCVSGQLREDIIMHTGRQLVQEVNFFKQLPRPVLIQISLLFQLVIYIEGDIIFKVHTIDDRMYFIHKGTVAFYTESGYEVLHIEDGEHFGEIALITDDKCRLGTAVAVTNCEIFTLSRENFGILECYPTAFEEIKKAAVKRMQWIKVMDKQYKAQLKA